ncbi:MAG: DUF4276 family protein [Methylicorpusculum sp.]|uniref:DUF4276 family protein n=1 Tax=Methylicorpusculum sp. TaxID=2713644 RepID=UPI0027303BF4|nr:DUF4276 family protein [Methylicorpusculum sp.]MDP2203751.1 DUF4276 family protein [Methylicorpusculum sp.]
MIRVHVICEGQTEEMFINEVLSDWFNPRGIYLFPSLIGKPGHKGGNFRYQRLLIDVRNRLLNDNTSYCTTFFDFYGLPTDFPGKQDAIALTNSVDKAECLLNALSEELQTELGSEALSRFIPYVQMYEFEGLLFSDTQALATGLNKGNLADRFNTIRSQFDTPEDINNSKETAPSKRIVRHFPEYDKPVHGSLAAMEIGLEIIRNECSMFDAWVKKIEELKPSEAVSQ